MTSSSSLCVHASGRLCVLAQADARSISPLGMLYASAARLAALCFGVVRLFVSACASVGIFQLTCHQLLVTKRMVVICCWLQLPYYGMGLLVPRIIGYSLVVDCFD